MVEKIKREGLALYLGIPGTAGLGVLEFVAGVNPPKLKNEELVMRQSAPEMTKHDD